MKDSDTTLEVELSLDEVGSEGALRDKVARRLAVPPAALPPLVVRKRSLDCRGKRVRFHFVVDVLPTLTGGEQAVHIGLAPGEELATPHPREVKGTTPVVIVGDGPCGLFCAYELARQGVASVVIDRGKPVRPRRKDLKGLTIRGTVDADSNYCFGEGGAGTYSDGKLYTRAHKRGDIRDVLQILTLAGAPPEILVEGRPHIGTNRLPQVITSIRERLEAVGVRFRFDARVTGVRIERGVIRGVSLANGEQIDACAVVLATGHSARDVYEMLAVAGHPLEPKAFALGVRIEHPQTFVNTAQYGRFASDPRVPSAAYSLVDSVAAGSDVRPAFSFCMCPGGFIVPASTEPGEVVVNGMSPSKRNSKYANSGFVVGVEPAHWQSVGFQGQLGGIDLQRKIESAAFEAGGGALKAPAVRVTDFMARRVSTTLPSCSYVPGLTATDLDSVLDAGRIPFADRLRAALQHFDRKMKGYISAEAVLVGVESRTSSPVRIPRHPETLQSPLWQGFYPAGEGAGYAGGIVSAAVDGMRVARQIAVQLGVRPTADVWP
jgi:uncharacterized protein